MTMKYETVIGLEVHVELATKSKAFCGCPTRFGASENTQVCPVCLGLPGSLPVLNKEALYYAVKAALAFNCKINNLLKFDRKNYFYPDLPKNYQISQYDMPLSHDGFLDIEINGGTKRIGITRVHLEEDTGKLLHRSTSTLIDYNRSGIPLLEIVSEPDINSPEEAYAYLTALKSILKYLDVSDCNMEEGSLRCDANLSIRPAGSAVLGTKTEVKNMNSFKSVKSALLYESERQARILDGAGRVLQETRLWDEAKKDTKTMRSKEEAHDYRYFPEPDLLSFHMDDITIKRITGSLPELPDARKKRLASSLGIPEYDAAVLTQDKAIADYFEEALKIYGNAKKLSNWMMTVLMNYLNEKGIGVADIGFKAGDLSKLLAMVDSGAISNNMAKDIFAELIASSLGPEEFMSKKGISQISDASELEGIADDVIKENKKAVEDYASGKPTAMGFLVGQVMKKSKGKANPHMVNDILKNKLKK